MRKYQVSLTYYVLLGNATMYYVHFCSEADKVVQAHFICLFSIYIIGKDIVHIVLKKFTWISLNCRQFSLYGACVAFPQPFGKIQEEAP